MSKPDWLELLEKALPIIEEENERRKEADMADGSSVYYTEMRDLADEMRAAIAKAQGEEP